MSIAKTRYLLQLAEDSNSAPDEIQLLRTGKFDDFWTGKFEINKKVLQEMFDNYKNKVRGVDLAIDFAHMNHLEAAAWIKDLELKENGKQLWAKIEWTELGREKVEKKLYRYLSAEFDTRYRDSESGKEFGNVLLGAGLTNRPFVKGMAPTINLAEEKIMEEKVKKLEESNVKLSDEVKTLNENIKSLSDANEVLKKENEELKDKIELSLKEDKFKQMLSEGKAVPAQKDAWIKGDLEAFAANANKTELNLNEKGSGESKEEENLKSEDDLISEAKKLAEKNEISESNAISELLEKPEFKHLNK